MPKFPNSHRIAALALLALVASCAAGLRAVGGVATHPAALVGEWIDSLHTTPTDTALWVLRDDGQDLSVHVAPDSATRAAGRVIFSRRHSYWYVDGSLADSTRALCFNARPGRSAPTCFPFVLDSSSRPWRLRVSGYQGEHRTATRVLLRRSVP